MNLKVDNISKKFGNNGLKEIGFLLQQGDFLCITGQSGCGKTTLLNIVSGMLTPDTGDVYINEKNIYYDMKEKERTQLRNQTIGYMMQGNSLIPDLTVWQNIICPVELVGKKVNQKEVKKLVKKLGIDNVCESFPSDISGGEYRRVLLARVMMLNTEILLVDEPTSNLDENSAKIVREVLYEMHKEKGVSIIVVTHDQEFFAYHPKRLSLY
ncbi:MAG: ATP-binding cassette domain-containing protein [Lachnospiraceae bacterium]|nr:ATP-binding cassette domain-containing protein [Lachnospiraceae bacterium]